MTPGHLIMTIVLRTTTLTQPVGLAWLRNDLSALKAKNLSLLSKQLQPLKSMSIQVSEFANWSANHATITFWRRHISMQRQRNCQSRISWSPLDVVIGRKSRAEHVLRVSKAEEICMFIDRQNVVSRGSLRLTWAEENPCCCVLAIRYQCRKNAC